MELLSIEELKNRLNELNDLKENEPDEMDEDELEELEELENIKDQLDLDRVDGLIYEDYFVEYCQEMIRDIGYISKDFPWFIEIDWDMTAENMKADYGEVELKGYTYYYRLY